MRGAAEASVERDAEGTGVRSCGAEVQDEDGGRDAVAGPVSVDSNPAHGGGDFGFDRNDNRVGLFAFERLRRDGYGMVGGVFKG